ncbi:hypothetical protein CRUP_008267 [Coryphaenoides rupestris]|nr:hypothetical protein CRUP_008267 [Coryphaenoides rupestris]
MRTFNACVVYKQKLRSFNSLVLGEAKGKERKKTSMQLAGPTMQKPERKAVCCVLVVVSMLVSWGPRGTHAWYKQVAGGQSYYSVGRASGLLSGIQRSPSHTRRAEPPAGGGGGGSTDAADAEEPICITEVKPNLQDCELTEKVQGNLRCKAEVSISLDSLDCLGGDWRPDRGAHLQRAFPASEGPDLYSSGTAARFSLSIWAAVTWNTTWTLAVSVAVVKWWKTGARRRPLDGVNMPATWRAAASRSRSAPVGRRSVGTPDKSVAFSQGHVRYDVVKSAIN